MSTPKDIGPSRIPVREQGRTPEHRGRGETVLVVYPVTEASSPIRPSFSLTHALNDIAIARDEDWFGKERYATPEEEDQFHIYPSQRGQSGVITAITQESVDAWNYFRQKPKIDLFFEIAYGTKTTEEIGEIAGRIAFSNDPWSLDAKANKDMIRKLQAATLRVQLGRSVYDYRNIPQNGQSEEYLEWVKSYKARLKTIEDLLTEGNGEREEGTRRTQQRLSELTHQDFDSMIWDIVQKEKGRFLKK